MIRLAGLLALMLLAGCQQKPLAEVCYQPAETGMCRAAIQRYYFDHTSGECRRFIWGGCGGSVPFEDRESCLSTCVSEPETVKEKQ